MAGTAAGDLHPDDQITTLLTTAFLNKLPRDLRAKLVSAVLVRVNDQHDAFRVRFSTGQEAVIPALKLADDVTIAQLCVIIR